jgi:hypothetical protein
LGGVPIPTRGIHCGTLYMYILCGLDQRHPSITEKKMVNIIKVLEHEESDRDDIKKETFHATVPLS